MARTEAGGRPDRVPDKPKGPKGPKGPGGKSVADVHLGIPSLSNTSPEEIRRTTTGQPTELADIIRDHTDPPDTDHSLHTYKPTTTGYPTDRTDQILQAEQPDIIRYHVSAPTETLDISPINRICRAVPTDSDALRPARPESPVAIPREVESLIDTDSFVVWSAEPDCKNLSESVGITPVELTRSEHSEIQHLFSDGLHHVVSDDPETSAWISRAAANLAAQTEPAESGTLFFVGHTAESGWLSSEVIKAGGSVVAGDRVLARYILRLTGTWILTTHGVPYGVASIISKLIAEVFVGEPTRGERMSERVISISSHLLPKLT